MRLADCFIDVLAYARLFLRRPSDDYAGFRGRIEQLLSDGTERARENDYAEDERSSALFAVCAFLDEAVLTSGWTQAHQWTPDPLQKRHFGTTRAGVEFFERLERLPLAQRSAREVYYFCLMLGFKGRFSAPRDQKELEDLKQRHLELLVEEAKMGRLDENLLLFPAAYPPQPATPERRQRQRLSTATIAVIAVPLAVLILLYLTYYALLQSLVGDVLSLIR
jgi:type VI secretion system protein ImpK